MYRETAVVARTTTLNTHNTRVVTTSCSYKAADRHQS